MVIIVLLGIFVGIVWIYVVIRNLREHHLWEKKVKGEE